MGANIEVCGLDCALNGAHANYSLMHYVLSLGGHARMPTTFQGGPPLPWRATTSMYVQCLVTQYTHI